MTRVLYPQASITHVLDATLALCGKRVTWGNVTETDKDCYLVEAHVLYADPRTMEWKFARAGATVRGIEDISRTMGAGWFAYTVEVTGI